MEIWVPTEQLETFASKKVEGLAASKGEEPVSIKKEEPVSKEEEEPVSKEEEEPASKEVEGLAERKEGEGSGDKRKNLWEEGKEYPVKLGESFLKERAKKRLCTFRYSFKPASVDAAGSAKYDALPGREAQVTHQGKVAAGGKAKEVIFQGKTNACVKTECVLIFDEDSNTFVLERLDTAVQSLQPQVDLLRPDNQLSACWYELTSVLSCLLL
ncbi:unnamed protein product [Chrysoparadoxa australica]